MNIYVVKPEELNEDEKRYLEKHAVVYYKEYEIVNADVVLSLSIDSILNASYLSSKYGKILACFIDWINPWEVFIDDESLWGFMEKIPYETKIKRFQEIYEALNRFKQAHVKMVSTPYVKDLIDTILNTNLTYNVLQRGYSQRKATRFYKNSPSSEFITIYSNLNDWEKPYHAVRALELISSEINQDILVLSDKKSQLIKQVAEANRLSLKFVKLKNKHEVFNKSSVIVSLTNKDLLSEAIYYNPMVVAYDTPYLRQHFGNNLLYANNDSIIDLSHLLSDILTNKVDNKVNIFELPSMENFIDGLVNKLERGIKGGY